MSTCPACTNARKHPLSGVFQMHCQDCVARGLSRMPQFHASAKQGVLTPEYRRALADQLPKLTLDEAHALVKGWATMAPRPQRENMR